ncbi:MAG TPA: DUF2860 family protein, partial [Psychromonas sp.]
MRKLFPAVILTILLTNLLVMKAAANSAPVARTLAEEAGWAFALGLNLGYSASRSQLNTDDDNALNNDLNNNGKAISNTLVFPLATTRYTFSELKTQIFVTDSREHISLAEFQYELGITHLFNNRSKLTVAYFPQLSFFNETWQDPYLIGSPRRTTDENAQGGRFALTPIAGSSITLKYAFAFTV